MSLTQIVPTGTTYLVNPVSGEVVCTREVSCAGITLLTAFRAAPEARGWLGLNGQPFTCLDPRSERELRSLVGSVCTCEMSA